MKFITQFDSGENTKFLNLETEGPKFATGDIDGGAERKFNEERARLIQEGVDYYQQAEHQLDGIGSEEEDIRAEVTKLVDGIFTPEYMASRVDLDFDSLISAGEAVGVAKAAIFELKGDILDELARDNRLSAARREELQSQLLSEAESRGDINKLKEQRKEANKEVERLQGEYDVALGELYEAHRVLGEAQGAEEGLSFAQELIAGNKGQEGLRVEVLNQIKALNENEVDLTELKKLAPMIEGMLRVVDQAASGANVKLNQLEAEQQDLPAESARLKARRDLLAGPDTQEGSIKYLWAEHDSLTGPNIPNPDTERLDQLHEEISMLEGELDALPDQIQKIEARITVLPQEIAEQKEIVAATEAKKVAQHEALDPILEALVGPNGNDGVLADLEGDVADVEAAVDAAYQSVEGAFRGVEQNIADKLAHAREDIPEREADVGGKTEVVEESYAGLQKATARRSNIQARIQRYNALKKVADARGTDVEGLEGKQEELAEAKSGLEYEVPKPIISATTLRFRPEPGTAKDNIYKTDKPGGEGVVGEGNHTFYLNDRNPNYGESGEPKFLDDSAHLSFVLNPETGRPYEGKEVDGYLWFNLEYSGPRSDTPISGWVGYSREDVPHSLMEASYGVDSMSEAPDSGKTGKVVIDQSLNVRTGRSGGNDYVGSLTKGMKDTVEVVRDPSSGEIYEDSGDHGWVYVRVKDSETGDVKFEGYTAARNNKTGDTNLEIS